jgi:hypothetical protein
MSIFKKRKRKRGIGGFFAKECDFHKKLKEGI